MNAEIQITAIERRKDERHDPSKTVTLISGDYYVTNTPGLMIQTILGSCVAACLHDPLLRVGGMNHFLLPEGPAHPGKHEPDDATRYGAYAMEQLINGIIGMGGQKRRLEAKVFGGGNVIDNSAMIGTRNSEFVRDFLQSEGIPIINEDLGGDYPRRVRFYPDTGRAQMLRLRRKEDMAVAHEEKTLIRTLKTKPVEGSIELF